MITEGDRRWWFTGALELCEVGQSHLPTSCRGSTAFRLSTHQQIARQLRQRIVGYPQRESERPPRISPSSTRAPNIPDSPPGQRTQENVSLQSLPSSRGNGKARGMKYAFAPARARTRRPTRWRCGLSSVPARAHVSKLGGDRVPVRLTHPSPAMCSGCIATPTSTAQSARMTSPCPPPAT
jgi:hypothetical protein